MNIHINPSLLTEDESYGTEIVLKSPSGNQRTLRANIDPAGAKAAVYHVRVCDPSGEEMVYWNSDEFGEDPQEVLGAMLGGWLGNVDTRLGAARPSGVNPAESLVRLLSEDETPHEGEEEVCVASPAGNGRSLRTNAGKPGQPLMGCDYLRVCDETGGQIGRWEAQDFESDPSTVLGALFAAYLTDTNHG